MGLHWGLSLLLASLWAIKAAALAPALQLPRSFYWFETLHPELDLVKAQSSVRVRPWLDRPADAAARYCAALRLEPVTCARLEPLLRQHMAAMRPYVPRGASTVVEVRLDWLDPGNWLCCLHVALGGAGLSDPSAPPRRLAFPLDPLEAARVGRRFCADHGVAHGECAALGAAVQRELGVRQAKERGFGSAGCAVPLFACALRRGQRLLIDARVDDRFKGSHLARFSLPLLALQSGGAGTADAAAAAAAAAAEEEEGREWLVTLGAFCSQMNCDARALRDQARACAAPLLLRQQQQQQQQQQHQFHHQQAAPVRW
jgi:hypothetical protein